MYFFEGKDGDEIHCISPAHKSSVYGVAFSPDSKRFITCSGDKTVKMWSIDGYKELKVFTFEKQVEDIQLGVHWSEKHGPISVNLAGDIQFLDEDNLSKPKRIVSGHNSTVTDAVFCKDSKTLFTCSMDGIIQWDHEKGSLGRVKGKQPKNGFQSIAILGDEIIAGGMDQTLHFTKLESMTLTGGTVLKMGCLVNSIGVNSDGFIFCATKKGITVIKDRKVVAEFSTDLECLKIAVHDNLIVVSQKDRFSGKILWYEFNGSNDFKLLKKDTEIHGNGAPTALKFNEDGTMLATGDANKNMYVWDTETKNVKYEELVFHAQKITMFDWAEDNKTLMSCSQDKTIIIWNLEEKKRVTVLAHQLGCALCKFVTPKKVVSMGQDYVLKVWDVEY